MASVACGVMAKASRAGCEGVSIRFSKWSDIAKAPFPEAWRHKRRAARQAKQPIM